MSNALAIATVTLSVKQLLNGALAAFGGDLPSPSVTTVSPGATGSPTTGINVFLYHVSANAAFRNEDLPTRRADGALVQRPRAALDLHFLLSFFGAEAHWIPQRLMGIAVQVLHAQPVLSPELIRAAIDTEIAADAGLSFLNASDLADSVERVRLLPDALSLEELSKIWSIFFQTRYVLSMAWRASVLLIEGDQTPGRATPTTTRNVYAVPVVPPRLNVIALVPLPGRVPDPLAPITPGARLRLVGANLAGDDVRVRIDDQEVIPAPGDVRVDRIDVQLPAGLRAGVHRAQLKHYLAMGTPAVPHRGVESNALAFVLQPRITGIVKSAVVSSTVGGVVFNSAHLVLTIDPAVGRSQSVHVWLNGSAGTSPRDHYAVVLPPRGPAQPASSTEITFDIDSVRSGSYALRIQVDGAESLLAASEDPPTLVLP